LLSAAPSTNRLKIKTSPGLHKLKACLTTKKKESKENKICTGLGVPRLLPNHVLALRDTKGEQQKIALGQ